MTKIRILLVDDNPPRRRTLAGLFNGHPDIHVAASCGTPDAMGCLRRVKPLLVVLDVSRRRTSGVRLVRSLMSGVPGVRVIGLGLSAVQHEVVRYVEAGMSGFVLKDAPRENVLATVRAVARGGNVLPPPLADSLFARIIRSSAHARPGRASAANRLTRREREVIALIDAGLSNKEIAARLHRSVDTVKSHVHAVLRKLGLRTRVEIASYARTDEGYRNLPPFTPRD